MRAAPFTLLVAALAFSLTGCNLVFKLPTRQGNVIEQKQLDQLKLGMTREQVVYLLGTPVAASPFRSDRWDYVGYYQSPRGNLATRTVTLHFDKDALSRMEGIEAEGASPASAKLPDPKSLFREAKQERNESERAADPAAVVDVDPASNNP